jgi:hypothetical protein
LTAGHEAAELAAARAAGTHQCPGPGCHAQVPDAMLMCKRHWGAVPRDLQRRVYTAYRFGQSMSDASPEYIDAMNAAIDSLRTGPVRRFTGRRP